MRWLIGTMVLAAMVLGGGPAARADEAALDLLDAPVAYSADFTLSSPRGTYHGKVWHAHGRERREVQTSGGGQGVLILRDSDAAYLLGLSGKWYVGLSLRAAGAAAGGLESWRVERSRGRDESVAGVKTTRWKTRADGPRGGFAGDIWISRDGVVVKAVGTLVNPDGDDSPVEMTLSSLRVGQVDAAKLDVPAGWFGFDLRQVPPEGVEKAIAALKPMLEGRR